MDPFMLEYLDQLFWRDVTQIIMQYMSFAGVLCQTLNIGTTITSLVALPDGRVAVGLKLPPFPLELLPITPTLLV